MSSVPELGLELVNVSGSFSASVASSVICTGVPAVVVTEMSAATGASFGAMVAETCADCTDSLAPASTALTT